MTQFRTEGGEMPSMLIVAGVRREQFLIIPTAAASSWWGIRQESQAFFRCTCIIVLMCGAIMGGTCLMR